MRSDRRQGKIEGVTDHCGSYLLVVSSVQVETDDGPLVLTREIEGGTRFYVDNEVCVSRFDHCDTGCGDGGRLELRKGFI